MNTNSLFELKQMLYSAFEKTCNTALVYDSSSKDAIAKLKGKELNIQTSFDLGSKEFGIIFNITFCENGIICKSPIDESCIESDASIRLPSLKLFANLIHTEKLLEDETVLIFGDRVFVNHLQLILSNLKIDWEEPLTQMWEDIAAKKMSQMVQDAMEQKIDSNSSKASK